MVSPIVNIGRNSTVDNWFSDVPLMRELADKKLSLVATLKKYKWEIPNELKKKLGNLFLTIQVSLVLVTKEILFHMFLGKTKMSFSYLLFILMRQ